MATRTLSLVDSVNLPANQWVFGAQRSVPERIQDATIFVTDPANEWFTTQGFVKTWGIQLQGYVGGPWDNVAPWVGWGWWLYEPGGDPRDVVANHPELWVPYGRHTRQSTTTVGLLLGWNRAASPLDANAVIRIGVQVDTAITLGASATIVS